MRSVPQRCRLRRDIFHFYSHSIDWNLVTGSHGATRMVKNDVWLSVGRKWKHGFLLKAWSHLHMVHLQLSVDEHPASRKQNVFTPPPGHNPNYSHQFSISSSKSGMSELCEVLTFKDGCGFSWSSKLQSKKAMVSVLPQTHTSSRQCGIKTG